MKNLFSTIAYLISSIKTSVPQLFVSGKFKDLNMENDRVSFIFMSDQGEIEIQIYHNTESIILLYRNLITDWRFGIQCSKSNCVYDISSDYCNYQQIYLAILELQQIVENAMVKNIAQQRPV